MAVFHTVPFSHMDIDAGFWHKRQQLNRTATITALTEQFAKTGRFDALKCQWKEGEPRRPHIFWDSDTAKWLESVAYLLQKGPLPELESMAQNMIRDIGNNQDQDGYFNSYFQTVEPQSRWQRRSDHELYCAGHLMEAAVAWQNATGRDDLLQIMCRYADYIHRVFCQEDSAAFSTPGHEEIELALVKMYHATGNEKYLALSRHFINLRGRSEKDLLSAHQPSGLYIQDHMPCEEQTEAVGHAVRACYLYAAMADIAREYSDEKLLAACDRLFDNIAEKRMYVTGGIGSTAQGEAFTQDYDLPNLTAYTETCASIALCCFAQRMLLLRPHRKYADTIERVLYNLLLASTSLDGKAFYYTNPQEIDLHSRMEKSWVIDPEWRPLPLRSEVFSCSCCPPNITRFVASVGDLIYTQSEERIYIHQYMANSAAIHGGSIRIRTEYPQDGDIRITARGLRGKTLGLRIPAWCMHFMLNVPYTLEDGYALVVLARDQADIRLTLSLRPTLVDTHPSVRDNAGKVCVMRGPVVYCMEGCDNAAPLFDLRIDAHTTFEEVDAPALGLPVLKCKGFKRQGMDAHALYQPCKAQLSVTTLTLIPYFALANRGAQDMRIWIPVQFWPVGGFPFDGARKLQYHFAPHKGWMNDPNGLVYFKGYYHVFYQHAPDFEIPWQQPMHWGHARTKDFITWEELPVALYPDAPYDCEGCWSGTAMVKDDVLYLFYASIHTPRGADRELQTVSVATSRDGVHFEKYEGNPVIAHYPPAGSPDFRDPAVCRVGDACYCVMATGHPETQTARLLLYESSDLLAWQLAGVMAQWEGCLYAECPSMLRTRDGCLLAASVCPKNGSHFFQVMYGSFENGVFTPAVTGQVDQGPDQYAGQVFLAPDGRALMMTWIPGWQYSGAFRKDAGCMSVPREIFLRNGKVCAYPAREVKHLIKSSDPAVEMTENGFIIRRHLREDIVHTGKVEQIAILRDNYVIEVFVNGGETVYTALLC